VSQASLGVTGTTATMTSGCVISAAMSADIVTTHALTAILCGSIAGSSSSTADRCLRQFRLAPALDAVREFPGDVYPIVGD